MNTDLYAVGRNVSKIATVASSSQMLPLFSRWQLALVMTAKHPQDWWCDKQFFGVHDVHGGNLHSSGALTRKEHGERLWSGRSCGAGKQWQTLARDRLDHTFLIVMGSDYILRSTTARWWLCHSGGHGSTTNRAIAKRWLRGDGFRWQWTEGQIWRWAWPRSWCCINTHRTTIWRPCNAKL